MEGAEPNHAHNPESREVLTVDFLDHTDFGEMKTFHDSLRSSISDEQGGFEYHNNLNWQHELAYQALVNRRSMGGPSMAATSTAHHEMLDILADPPATTLAGSQPAAAMPGPMMTTPDMAAHPMTALPVAAPPMAPFFMAAPIKHAPLPTNFNQPSTSTDHHSPQTTDNAINASHNTIYRPRRTMQRVTKLRKSCNRCHGRKLKCIIVQGTDPKLCTKCAKKGLACVFEAKKPYTRKTAT